MVHDVINHGCRPTDDSNQPPGRGVLSMHGLTYGVIRVDSEEKLSVLTVQDVGLVMPGGKDWKSFVWNLVWVNSLI